MIEVELSLTFTVYLLLVLAIFLFLWIRQEEKKKFTGPGQETGYLWQCPICTFIYLDPEEDSLSCCPRCQSFNRRDSKKKERGPGGD